ncbi:MAG TPA: methionyl-tRNA formyltransferase [Acidimicrobiia bacterium]|nr:methionyl-tRNA formyltransferase [Acidimicrobiia bacterium]
MTSPLRIVFFGSPEPARDVLESLINSPHKIVAVITQPDKKRGRGSALIPTPVKELAIANDIEVFEPATKAEVYACVEKLKADVGVVVAYGRILSVEVLEHFSYGCINVHYSLLPRWRGAAPVERAILAGDNVSGVSIMKMEEGLDTGGVYAYRHVDIVSSTTSATLFRSMNAIARDLLLVVLDSIETQEPLAQVGEPTYAHKLDRQNFYFDSSTSAADVDRKVRAGALIKGAWTIIGEKQFRLIEADFAGSNLATGLDPAKLPAKTEVGKISREGVLTCVDGTIICKKIQVEGKPVMEFSAWANGLSRELFPLHLPAGN